MKWHKTITKSIPLALMLMNTSTHSQPAPRATPGSGAGEENGRSAIPKLGEYIELDEALKNEMYGTIDFPNAELTTIIKAISKLANKNFILDNKIQNHRVTIVSPVPVSKQDAYNAFLSALYMNNLTIVSAGKFLKIVEAKTAYAENTRVFVGDYAPATEEVVTVLYPLKNLNADDINRFVVDLVPRTGRVITFPDTNTIVMTTSGLILRRVIAILKAVDVPGHQDQLESIPINHASAKQIAELLDEILEAQGGSSSSRRSRSRRSSRSSSTQKTRGGGIITKIVPDERTNSLVVLANGRGIAELKQLISKLDTPSIAGSGNIHIYYCKNAESEALATTLSNLIQAQKSDQPKRDGANLPTPPTRSTRNSSSNDDVTGGVQLGGNVRVTADKATNSLVILASASDFAALKQVLTKLDLPRRQVYVEATIMEVAVSDNNQFGVGVNIAADNIAQVGGFIPSTISSGQFTDLISKPAGLSGLVAGIAAGRTVSVQGGNGIEINSVIGLIRAIEDTNQGQILHQPQILIADNEEAEINVVDKIPVPKTENVAIGNQISQNETFEKEEIKISLKITPQIGEDNDLVRLKVEQKVDDFSPVDKGQLKVTERSANTNVTVKNGDTVVIGGLQKRESKDVRSKFPILGDLPILGWLFKGSNATESRTQLILFLKPKIIDEYGDLLNLTKDKLDTRKKIGKALEDPEDRHEEEIDELININKNDIERNNSRGWGLKKTSKNAVPNYDKGDSFSSDERVEGLENKSVSDLEAEINAIEDSLNQPPVTAQAPRNLEAAQPELQDNTLAPPPQEPGPEMIDPFQGDE